jgi:hypothetical protein
MVLSSLIHFGDRIKAGIDIVGIANFITFLEQTSPYRQDLRRAEYGDERDPLMRAVFERINPTSHAEKIRSALLVAHGRNDPRVPFAEAQQIAAKVRAAGRPVWTIYAENEGHGFAKKDNSDYLTAVEVMFLRRHLGLDVAADTAADREGTAASEADATEPASPAEPSSDGTSSGRPGTGRPDGLPGKAKMRQEILDLEHTIAEAVVRGDTEFVRRVWADDFFYTGIRGEVKSKADILADLEAGTLKFDVMKFDDIRVRIYGETAVATGLATTRGRGSSGEITGRFRYTRVYHQRDGQWQLVLFQGTPAGGS